MTGRRLVRGLTGVLAGAAITAVLHELAARRYYRTAPGPDRIVHEDERVVWTPLWREWLAPAEWLRLRSSPVHRGRGVPRGDGAPVLLVHGFLTRGLYLTPLRRWLERIGYQARVADIGWNADCLDVLADRLLAEVRHVHASTGRPVALIGHSAGGLLVRAVAAAAPELIASIALLAAPVRGLRVHPALELGAMSVRAGVHARRRQWVDPKCLTLACSCPTVSSLARPVPPDVPHLAVVARGDGLTDWRYAVDRAATRVVEVDTSHFGLVVSQTVYEALGQHLARSFAARASVTSA
jgi:pimeloyl-ACP methyl ester carboxylesterase